jgi:hypothetical protein
MATWGVEGAPGAGPGLGGEPAGLALALQEGREARERSEDTCSV